MHNVILTILKFLYAVPFLIDNFFFYNIIKHFDKGFVVFKWLTL